MNVKQIFLGVLVVASSFSMGGEVSAAGEFQERDDLTMKIGDAAIVHGSMAYRTGVVLDSNGTVHVLSIDGASDVGLTRISRKGVAEQIIMYRGWPFLLDKSGRLFALDTSMWSILKNKLPYMSLRMVKTFPLAIGVGFGAYAIGYIDQTFLSFLPSTHFQFGGSILGGIGAYYGLDMAYTVFFRNQKSIGPGGNFFTDLIAKNVESVSESKEYDDYIVTFRHGFVSRESKQVPLSKLASKYQGKSCAKFLTRITL